MDIYVSNDLEEMDEDEILDEIGYLSDIIKH